jgi:hypothetical protein
MAKPTPATLRRRLRRLVAAVTAGSADATAFDEAADALAALRGRARAPQGQPRRRGGGRREESLHRNRRAGAVPVPDILRDHEGSRRPRVRPGNLTPMACSGLKLDWIAGPPLQLVKFAPVDFNLGGSVPIPPQPIWRTKNAILISLRR